MGNVLSFKDVSFVRNGRAILDSVSWEVDSAERWVILGPNGAGKTSLLRLATANDYPSSGTVDVLQQRLGTFDIWELRNRIGFAATVMARRIPRDETVRNVVLTAAYGVEGRWNEQYDSYDEEHADGVLSDWNLQHLADHRFDSLSDGEQKRVLIARSVMTDPELLLLDEPSASLDLGARERLLQLLSEYARSPYAPAMMMVTHHVEEIPPGFTHVLLLADGRIHAAGPIADTLTEANLSATFGIDLALTQEQGRYSAVARVTPAIG